MTPDPLVLWFASMKLRVGVIGCVGEGLQITGAVEQLVFQSEITKQRGGDRLALLNHRFREGCGAAQPWRTCPAPATSSPKPRDSRSCG